MLIFLIGINDFSVTLAFEGGSTVEAMNEQAENLRKQVAQGGGWVRPTLPLYKHLQLYRLIRTSRAAELASLVPTSVLEQLRIGPTIYISEKRKQRAASPVSPLPDLTIGLGEYKERIIALGEECRAFGTRCLFLTQPALYRSDLTADEESLLWFGWVGRVEGPIGYVSAGEMELGLAAYNQKLLETCEQEQLECFDIARHIPKNTTVFYDDMHYNEEGAKLFSRVLSDYILTTVSNQQKWDTLGAERSGAGWRSGELPEGPVVASSPFGGLSLHLLPAL